MLKEQINVGWRWRERDREGDEREKGEREGGKEKDIELLSSRTGDPHDKRH